MIIVQFFQPPVTASLSGPNTTLTHHPHTVGLACLVQWAAAGPV